VPAASGKVSRTVNPVFMPLRHHSPPAVLAGAMTQALSDADVARLLADPSARNRASLAEKLAHDLDGDRLGDDAMTLAQDVVRLLARDVEVAVRAAVSHSLRHSRHLPRDVALRLAHDIEAVSLPLLAHSPMLTDDDLVALVRTGSPPRQAAIATRPTVSEPVSASIVTHADEKAVAALMGNPGAGISPDSLTRAVERFPDSEAVTGQMVRRETLPIAVAERLAALVSARLQTHLIQHHDLSPSIAADIVLRSREIAVIRLSAGAGEAALLCMVRQMHNSGRLDSSLVLRALCTGDIAFFEVAMAVLANVPVENARILIHDGAPGALAGLYRKADMPPSWFQMIRAAVDVVDGTGFDGRPRDLQRYRSRVITRVLTQLKVTDPVESDYLVDRLGEMLTEDA